MAEKFQKNIIYNTIKNGWSTTICEEVLRKAEEWKIEYIYKLKNVNEINFYSK